MILGGFSTCANVCITQAYRVPILHGRAMECLQHNDVSIEHNNHGMEAYVKRWVFQSIGVYLLHLLQCSFVLRLRIRRSNAKAELPPARVCTG